MRVGVVRVSGGESGVVRVGVLRVRGGERGASES